MDSKIAILKSKTSRKVFLILGICLVVILLLVVAFYIDFQVYRKKERLNTRFQQARMLYNGGIYDEALTIFESIIEENPNFLTKYDEDAYQYIALILEKKGDRENAKTGYRESISRKLAVSSYLYLSAILLKDKQYQESVDLLEDAIKKTKFKDNSLYRIIGNERLFYSYGSLKKRETALENLTSFFTMLEENIDTPHHGIGTGKDYATLWIYVYSRDFHHEIKSEDWYWIRDDPGYKEIIEHYKKVFDYENHVKEIKAFLEPEKG